MYSYHERMAFFKSCASVVKKFKEKQMGHRNFTKLDVPAAMARIKDMTKDIQEMSAYSTEFPYFDNIQQIRDLKRAAETLEERVYNNGKRP